VNIDLIEQFRFGWVMEKLPRGGYRVRTKAGNFEDGDTPDHAAQKLENYLMSLQTVDLEPAPKHPEMALSNGFRFEAHVRISEHPGFFARQWVWEQKK